MLPHQLGPRTISTPTRAAVDSKLMERAGVDEFSLRRIRKEFMYRCQRVSYGEAKLLAEGGTCPRFSLMVALIREIWPMEQWTAWLRFLEHSQRDIDEMCHGEYPISPYLVRVFSALFAIKVDFLLLGAPPCIDRKGVSIDIGPLTNIR